MNSLSTLSLFFLSLAVMPLSASNVEQKRAEEVGKTYKVFGANNAQVYHDVTVTKITDAGITIMHSDGLARLRYDHLSAEQREKFGITREDAEAIYAKEEKARAAYEALVAAKEREREVARQKAEQERQQAREAMLAKQAALLEVDQLLAEHSAAEHLEAPQAQAQAEATNTASIVSTVELPHFPIIRGYDKEIFRPMQGYTRSYRSRHYGSGTAYPVYYGGSYGYPSHCGSYRPSYHRGSWGWINYRRGDWNIGIQW